MLHVEITDTGIKDYSKLKNKLLKIKRQKPPVFETCSEDLVRLRRLLKKYNKYRNIIVIGNGGSNTSFKAYCKALVPMGFRKKAFILTTMEPDLLNELKGVFPKRKSLVMPVSKSGTTIGLLESLFAFDGYDILPVTSPASGALSVIAKENKLDIIPHAPVGGRYSGLTASAFAPAVLMGIDVERIDNGARTMYKYCNPQVPIDKNPALQLASALFLLEKKGYDEIFCPIYSSKLAGFENLIIQLMHESVCKNRKGQTIYCAEAPESQHHTNQRFFGGKRNVLGLFITVENQQDNDSRVVVPDSVKSINVREGTLRDIDKVQYSKALHYEFQGTYQDAVKNNIPVVKVSIDKVSPFSVGEFLGFWHYVAVYSALLRGVDPFDQPQVEASKEISFRLRRDHHF